MNKRICYVISQAVAVNMTTVRRPRCQCQLWRKLSPEL